MQQQIIIFSYNIIKIEKQKGWLSEQYQNLIG